MSALTFSLLVTDGFCLSPSKCAHPTHMWKIVGYIDALFYSVFSMLTLALCNYQKTNHMLYVKMYKGLIVGVRSWLDFELVLPKLSCISFTINIGNALKIQHIFMPLYSIIDSNQNWLIHINLQYRLPGLPNFLW